MDCACFGEVESLHQFFQGWYRGDKRASFDRLEEALADEFAIVTPHGAEYRRGATLKNIKADHGTRPDFTIETVSRSCRRFRGLHLTSYEELQAYGESTSARLSTALLEQRGDSWLWHHVHETWMPPTES